MSIPTIAIIGGGPGGLTLARILKTKGIQAVVYERDVSPQARSQGGTLDLHTNSGQRALKEAGLYSQFEQLARREGQDTRIFDKTGKVRYDEITDPNDTSRPEIDRPALRNILLDSLDPDTVKWGHTLASISPLENGVHTLTFENGSTSTASLVVGADGAFSRVRPLLSPSTPEYTGLCYLEARLTGEKTRREDISKVVGRGGMLALEHHKGLLAQRNSGDNIRVYIVQCVPIDHFKSLVISSQDPQKSRQILLDMFSDWDPSLTVLLRECDDIFEIRPIYTLPVGHSWKTTGSVTLLGDAAHLMAPSGEGVNLAMQDALELALAISSKPDSLFDAIRTYEEALFARGKAAAEDAIQINNAMFRDPNAPAQMVGFFESMGESLKNPSEGEK